jgi:hypothetical protein
MRAHSRTQAHLPRTHARTHMAVSSCLEITNRQTRKAAALTQTNTRTQRRGRKCSRARALARTHAHTPKNSQQLSSFDGPARTQRHPPRHTNTCTYSHKRCHAHSHAHTHSRTRRTRRRARAAVCTRCIAGGRRSITLGAKASSMWCGCLLPTARTPLRRATTGPSSAHAAAGVPFVSYSPRGTGSRACARTRL